MAPSGTVGAVRNETSGMATGGRDVDVNFVESRNAYWMPIGRLTLGVSLAR